MKYKRRIKMPQLIETSALQSSLPKKLKCNTTLQIDTNILK